MTEAIDTIIPSILPAGFYEQINVVLSASGGGNPDEVVLYILYGFPSEHPPTEGGKPWTDVVVKVSEFLKRTCLTYCEFIELWKSGFVKFGLKGNREKGFPESEPCCLDEYVIEFIDRADPAQALKQLAIFIRLWHTLRNVPNARYTFTELRDICRVLELFTGVNVNLDFIRQLAAFQMCRDVNFLPVFDNYESPPASQDQRAAPTVAVGHVRLVGAFV